MDSAKAAILAIVLGVALIVGLVTLSTKETQRLNAYMAAWVGRTETELRAEMGGPQEVQTAVTGERTLVYLSTRISSNDGAVKTKVVGKTTYRSYTPPPASISRTTRTFWVDQGGLITKAEWKGF